MTTKYLAAFAVSVILTLVLPISVGLQNVDAVELAGADEEDKEAGDQLLNAGQVQLPAPYLKVVETKSTSSVKPVPDPQPRSRMVEPEPDLKRAETAKMVLEPELKSARPVKRAAQAVSKATPVVEKKAASEPDQPTVASPYIRIDVGYGFTLNPEGTTTAGDMTDEDLANLALIGAGVGYRYSENLRIDLNADYRAGAGVDGVTPGGSAVSSKVNGLTVVLNGYYDVGTLEGFIPYVGGGVGFTRLETTAQTGTAAAGDTSTNLAWALNLGSAILIGSGESTMADLNYRFVRLGDFNQQDGTTYDDLMIHELRVGFRHQF